MSHVLLGGDEHQVSELRFLLSKWGVTVGQLEFADNVPTILDCDAVVLQGNPKEYRDACLGAVPDGSGGAAGPAAPLIFINGEAQAPRESLPVFWLVLDHLDSDGANLWRALRNSFAAAGAARGEAGCGHEADIAGEIDNDSYLDFLGHELRSPLTAIKTSLEVLESELGSSDRPRIHDDSRRMLAIALRNVGRLHETVEWSQGLAAASASSGMARPQEVAVAELAACLQDVGEVRVAASIRDLELRTDLELLTVLARQMAHAVGMACPGRSLVFRLAVDPADAGRLLLEIAADNRAADVSELQRLVRFLVVPQIVQELQATLTTSTAGKGRTALVLTLDLLPEALLSS